MLALVAATGAAGWIAPQPAQADGALPDAEVILAPADRPGELILVTNFGLLFTEDAGQTWLWSCERDENRLGIYYQLGPPPRRRLFAVANRRVIYSDDAACGWSNGAGMLDGVDEGVSDVWVDPVTPDRVLGVGTRCCEGGHEVTTIFESTNGGATFDLLRYQPPAGAWVSGVETARSAPLVTYATLSAIATTSPLMVARSLDGGATWTEGGDLSAQLGPGVLRLLGVDRAEPERLFLLVSGGTTIGVSQDGGATAQRALTVTGLVRGFAQAAPAPVSPPPPGVVLVATDNDGTPSLFRSRDGGATFDSVASPPHIRGLVARDGVFYAATDDLTDGFALATSLDDGETWTPLFSYDRVTAIAPCVKALCQEYCSTLVPLWPSAVCSVDAPPPQPDAGAPADAAGDAAPDGAGGSGAGGVGGDGIASGNGGSPGATGVVGGDRRSDGCGCHAAESVDDAGNGGAVLVGAALGARVINRRRRRAHPPASGSST